MQPKYNNFFTYDMTYIKTMQTPAAENDIVTPHPGGFFTNF